MRYLLVAVVASAITLFALQNTTPISLRFLFWSLAEVPLASVILASVGGGIVLVGFPLLINRWRLRSRARSLEAQLADAEARAAKPEPPTSPPGSA